MIAVALETSTRTPSIAVSSERGEREVVLEAGRSHASDLMPSLDEMLAELGLSARAIGAVFVGTGPGSYTGLRVGIATALGLARGAGASILGLPSGETLCFRELRPGEEAVRLVDARQGEIYFAHYRRTGDDVEIVRAPCVVEAGEAAALVPPSIALFGDATVAEVAKLDGEARQRLATEPFPRASALLSLGERRLAQRGADAPGDVAPLYLRGFGAHRSRR